MSPPLSKPFARPCVLDTRRSLALETFLCGGHLAAFAIIWSQPLPLLASIAGSLGLGVGLKLSLAAIRPGFRLLCDRYGRWFVGPADDAEAVSIAGATLASRIGLFLSYRRSGHWRIQSRFIPVWTLERDVYRQIRQRITITVDRDLLDR